MISNVLWGPPLVYNEALMGLAINCSYRGLYSVCRVYDNLYGYLLASGRLGSSDCSGVTLHLGAT
jgi:hypothetical protein